MLFIKMLEKISFLKHFNKFIDKECFVNIFAVIHVLATIPISSSSCERSISTLQNLKNYLRNTMSHDRHNGLALMDTRTEIELDLNELIDLFQPTPQKNEDGKYLRYIALVTKHTVNISFALSCVANVVNERIDLSSIRLLLFQ